MAEAQSVSRSGHNIFSCDVVARAELLEALGGVGVGEALRVGVVLGRISQGTDRTFPTMSFVFFAARRPAFVLTNVALPTLLISLLSFVPFALDPIDFIADRLALAFSLVLTTVAFKSTISTMVPAVSYLTWMDNYVLMSMSCVFLSVLISAIIYACMPHEADSTDARGADSIALAALFGFWFCTQLYYFVQAIFAKRLKDQMLADLCDLGQLGLSTAVKKRHPSWLHTSKTRVRSQTRMRHSGLVLYPTKTTKLRAALQASFRIRSFTRRESHDGVADQRGCAAAEDMSSQGDGEMVSSVDGLGDVHAVVRHLIRGNEKPQRASDQGCECATCSGSGDQDTSLDLSRVSGQPADASEREAKANACIESLSAAHPVLTCCTNGMATPSTSIGGAPAHRPPREDLGKNSHRPPREDRALPRPEGWPEPAAPAPQGPQLQRGLSSLKA